MDELEEEEEEETAANELVLGEPKAKMAKIEDDV